MGSKKIARAGIACVMSLVMLFSGSALSLSKAAKAPKPVYEFDHTKTAVSQLEDLFTTIDIMDATVADLSEEMETGNVTSERLVQMYIDRINAYDKKQKINSIIGINPNAIKEAQQLDAERKAGKIRGPLHGIPVLIKDNYDLEGTATTAGSLALANWSSKKDAFVVQKLKEAGAVIVAKANLSEFAASAIDSHSLIGGYVHNPYDLTRSPAGSSGGSGAAVTCNFATIGFGTDTGGSIRNPSSWCNLYGIRPSKGLTSIDGVFPLEVSRDTTGPLARTAEDMALSLEVIAGTDPKDDFTQEADANYLLGDGYTKYLSKDGLKGKRIGYLNSSFSYTSKENEDDEDSEEILHEPDPKVSQMIKRTRADLKKAGAVFVDMSDVLTDDYIMDIYKDCAENDIVDTTEYDINKYLHEHDGNTPCSTLKELFETGKYGIEYTNLDREKDEYASSFEETENPYTADINGFKRKELWSKILSYRAAINDAMEEKNVDAIMFVQDLNVPVHDTEDPNNNMAQIVANANAAGRAYSFILPAYLGNPSMVLPMGFSETDESCTIPMPLGMHIIGKFGGEKALMEIAYAYEQQAGPDIRQAPACAPALCDANLNAYLEALMNEVYIIDYSAFGSKPEGRAKLMEKAYDKAAAVDMSDPYAVYDAAYNLADAYDKTIADLRASGINLERADIELASTQYTYTGSEIMPDLKVKVGGVTLNKDLDYVVAYDNNLNAGTASVTVIPANDSFAGSKTAHFNIAKGSTSFKVKATKKKVKVSALKKKKRTVPIKVSELSKGSSKVTFTIKKVTNKQKAKVTVGKKSGKVTIKKNTKKCVIYVKATSKENSNRKAKSKTVKITVK